MVGGASERPAKLTSPALGLGVPMVPSVECLRPPRLGMLNNKSAHQPPRCAGGRPGALSVSVSLVRRGQNRRERVCAMRHQDNRVCVAFYAKPTFKG